MSESDEQEKIVLSPESARRTMASQFQAYTSLQKTARSALSITAAVLAIVVTIGLSGINLIIIPDLTSTLSIISDLVAYNPSLLFLYVAFQLIPLIMLVLSLMFSVTTIYKRLVVLAFGTGSSTVLYGNEETPAIAVDSSSPEMEGDYTERIESSKLELEKAYNTYRSVITEANSALFSILFIFLISIKYYYPKYWVVLLSDLSNLIFGAGMVVAVTTQQFIKMSDTISESDTRIQKLRAIFIPLRSLFKSKSFDPKEKPELSSLATTIIFRRSLSLYCVFYILYSFLYSIHNLEQIL